MDVRFKQKAYLDIENLIAWIISEGYPLTAFKFSKRLIRFCEHLKVYPEKFSICRFEVLAKRNYRCAVFARNYIIVYKLTPKQVIIMRVFHTSRLKA